MHRIGRKARDVANWHLADIGLCAAHVCFRGKADAELDMGRTRSNLA